MPILKIDESNFDSEVIKSDIPVLVDFFATWCGPCKMISPMLDEISDEMQGKIKICKVDIDVSPELATKYGVMSVPTLMFMKKGDIIDTSVGGKSKDDILNMISK